MVAYRCTSRLTLVLVAASVLTGAPGQALAERFFDIYGGVAFTDDDSTTLGDVPFGSSFTVGLRAGGWLDPIDYVSVGLSADVSYFNANPSSGDIHMLPTSLLGMVRVRLLGGDSYEHGRLQPYVGAGPAFVIGVAKGQGGVGREFEIGVDVRVGAKFMLTEGIGVFGEYRYLAVGFDGGLDVKTNAIQAGISF